MSQRSEPFADFDQTELDLLDEQARQEISQRIHSIYAPHDVQIEEQQLESWTLKVPCIVYPVPEHWWPEVTDASLFDLTGGGQWGWESGGLSISSH